MIKVIFGNHSSVIVPRKDQKKELIEDFNKTTILRISFKNKNANQNE